MNVTICIVSQRIEYIWYIAIRYRALVSRCDKLIVTICTSMPYVAVLAFILHLPSLEINWIVTNHPNFHCNRLSYDRNICTTRNSWISSIHFPHIMFYFFCLRPWKMTKYHAANNFITYSMSKLCHTKRYKYIKLKEAIHKCLIC